MSINQPKIEDLLLKVFEELRKQRIPLGVSEYVEVVKALRDDNKLEDKAKIKRFCRLLWAKSREDQQLFELAFAKKFEPAYDDMLTTVLEPIEPDELNPKPNLPPTLPSLQPLPPETKPLSLPPITAPAKPLTASIGKPTLFESVHPTLTNMPPYQLVPRLPMERRDIAGIWRHLRQKQRSGTLEELDVEGTIHQITRFGRFLGPVMQARHRNRAKLVILVDRQGSMTPLDPYVTALLESILRGGLLGQTDIFYFHDVPEIDLYKQPALLRAIPIETVLGDYCRDNSVLIVSDAGAARGTYEYSRLEATKAFLKDLRQFTYLAAWLNPIPQPRWKRTTAEYIAKLIPMYSLDREGLNDTVDVLRGQPGNVAYYDE